MPAKVVHIDVTKVLPDLLRDNIKDIMDTKCRHMATWAEDGAAAPAWVTGAIRHRGPGQAVDGGQQEQLLEDLLQSAGGHRDNATAECTLRLAERQVVRHHRGPRRCHRRRRRASRPCRTRRPRRLCCARPRRSALERAPLPWPNSVIRTPPFAGMRALLHTRGRVQGEGGNSLEVLTVCLLVLARWHRGADATRGDKRLRPHWTPGARGRGGYYFHPKFNEVERSGGLSPVITCCSSLLTSS